MSRHTHYDQEAFWYRSDGAKILAIFIHGLGGTNTGAYWGRLPDFLAHDDALSDFDFCYWSYPSSKSPIANLPPRFLFGPKLASPETVAATFANFVSLSSARYQKCMVFGHSLGGLIALAAVDTLRANHSLPQMKRFAFNGTPCEDVGLARLYSRITFGMNPHVSFLADKDRVANYIHNVVSAIRKDGIWTTYLYNDLDQLITRVSGTFDERRQIPGEHTWFPSVHTREDTRYETLRRWLLGT